MIWCLGMYASGSTWLYNTARTVAQTVQPDAKVTGTYAEALSVLKRLAPDALNIVKTHNLGRAETNLMALQATRILVSVRYPRDAVTSLMQHMRHSFAQALERVEKSSAFCAHFARDPRAEIFSYDAGFIDDATTLDRLATVFGGALTQAARDDIFAQSRRAAIEAKIARFEELPNVVRDARSGDEVDLDTQWHRHHAGRTGETGRWQHLLPPEAARLIERRMEDWMRQFGYLAE
jgi:hypothetical protein